MRGYNKRVATAFDGQAADILTWSDNDTTRHIMFGTEQKVYSYDGDTNVDVTPLVSSVALVSVMDYVSGEVTVGVSSTNHNLNTGDWITFLSSTVTAGITLVDQVCLVSVVDVDNYEFVNSTPATGTFTDIGSALVGYLLPTGNANAIQGLGYGAGVYNAGVSTTGMREWDDPATTSNITFPATNWSFDTWGEDVLMARRGGQIYYYDTDVSITPQRAVLVTAAPSVNNVILVSPNDRHLISFGSIEYLGVYNPLLVRWSDQEDYNEWTPSITTTAGETVLTDGSQIIGAIRSRNLIGVFTDNALYGMQFVGPPFIFSFRQLGTACGLVSQHAAVNVDGRMVWMGENNFFIFDGQIRNLDCTVRRYIYDDINTTQQSKIFAGINSEFKEVVWLYPSSNSDEPDRYVMWNYGENTWVYGESLWTTYADRVVYDNTITTSNTSYLYNNEPEDYYSADGAAITSYLESADFDIKDGHDLMFIDRVIPDFDINDGNIQFSIFTKQFPAADLVERGPFNINSGTQQIQLRARGRQARVKVSSYNDNTYWRYGAVRLDIKPDGQQ
jgi:hypothetical protein